MGSATRGRVKAGQFQTFWSPFSWIPFEEKYRRKCGVRYRVGQSLFNRVPKRSPFRPIKALTEEELTIFDLLTKSDPVLTKAEEREVKKVAKELLQKLKE